jgi:ferredoxin-NADP reductase
VDRFVPGGFGENFVTAHMNERNVCIGDIISVGPEVVLQVSLPRMPCFKLNHRFSLKDFAPTVYKTSRTGWYYRVMKEGSVSVGDELRLMERKWPQWTVERVQEYLHRETDNVEMNKLLSEVEALGEESRGQFRNRAAKAMKKTKPKDAEEWRDFKITSRKMETPRIVALTLEAVAMDPDLELDAPGAHAKIKLSNGLVRTYSVVDGDEGDDFSANNKLELGIALEENSRGGSRYLHEEAKVGDVVQVGRVTTDFNFASAASNHVFIAGGVGITAFLCLLRLMRFGNWNHELHYAVRSPEEVAFAQRLKAHGENVTIYDKTKGQRMDIDAIVKDLSWNSHLYVCGPERMMQAAKTAVDKYCVPPHEVSFEAFAADGSGDPFEAEVVNKGGKVLKVAEDESLLEAIRREFKEYPSSCEVGNCSTCKVTLKDGKVAHRGTALMPDEQKDAMLSCVSRGIGRIAIEI